MCRCHICCGEAALCFGRVQVCGCKMLRLPDQFDPFCALKPESNYQKLHKEWQACAGDSPFNTSQNGCCS